MRKQSFHSSVRCYTKESSIDTPSFETLDSASLKPVRAVKPVKVAKRVGVTTIVMEKLEQYRKPEQKYYNLIKLIADPYFLVACYEEIEKNKGNFTPRSDGYSIDRLNWEWFVQTSEALKSGIFVFKTNRRVEIPKANGKTRPLDINFLRDQIVQKALHAVLEAIFEPKLIANSPPLKLPMSVGNGPASLAFENRANVQMRIGQREGESGEMPLQLSIGQRGLRAKHNWVIQGDIAKCFEKIPHGIIMNRIKKDVGDPRFLELLNKFLKAEYLEKMKTKLVQFGFGTHQGLILRPLLVKIVLLDLDLYMLKYETSLNKGLKRRFNPEYISLTSKRSRATDHLKRRSLIKKMRILSSSRTVEPDSYLRRLEYIRYDYDFVVFVSGSLKDAKFIQSNIKDVLNKKCGLERNQEITNLRKITKENLSFIGGELKIFRQNSKRVLLDQSKLKR